MARTTKALLIDDLSGSMSNVKTFNFYTPEGLRVEIDLDGRTGANFRRRIQGIDRKLSKYVEAGRLTWLGKAEK